MFAAIVAFFVSIPPGYALGLTRDQGQPWYIPKAEKDRRKAAGEKHFDDWREIGMVVFGLPFGILTWRMAVAAGDGAWWAAAWGVFAYAATALAWSQGHKEALDLSDLRDWLVDLGMGAAVTAGPAIALAAHGHYLLAPLVLLAGAFKAPAYAIGYALRGRGDVPWPHPTAIGAILHAMVAYAVTNAALAACL